MPVIGTFARGAGGSEGPVLYPGCTHDGRYQGAGGIVPVQLPDLAPYLVAWPTLCTAEAVAAHAATYPSRRDAYGPWFRGWLDLGASVSEAEYARAHWSGLALLMGIAAIMLGQRQGPAQADEHREVV